MDVLINAMSRHRWIIIGTTALLMIVFALSFEAGKDYANHENEQAVPTTN